MVVAGERHEVGDRLVVGGVRQTPLVAVAPQHAQRPDHAHRARGEDRDTARLVGDAPTWKVRVRRVRRHTMQA